MQYKYFSSNNCPYCDMNDFSFVDEKRPDQHIMQCSGCLYYSVLKLSNNRYYPMSDPEDFESLPGKFVIVEDT